MSTVSPTSSVSQPSLSPPSADVQTIMNYFGMDQATATKFYNSLSPEVQKLLLSRINGEKLYTKSEFMAMGLDESTATRLVDAQGNKRQRGPDGRLLGLKRDPMADLLLQIIMIAESLGIDMKKLRVSVSVDKKNIMIKAADERFQGAQNAFIANMVVGAVSIGGGAVFWRMSSIAGPDKNQWYSPITVQLFVAPGTSAGQYLDAQGQLQGDTWRAVGESADVALTNIGDLINILQNIVNSANSGVAKS